MQTNYSLPPPGRWIFPCFTRKKTEGVPLFNANYLTDKSKFGMREDDILPYKINIKLRRGGVLPPEKCDKRKKRAHGVLPYEVCANIMS